MRSSTSTSSTSKSTSLARRVAAGAALGASAAALLAALATGLISRSLLQAADDRRLHEAAVILAAEIDDEPHDVAEVVAGETLETAHMAIELAVHDAAGALRAGVAAVAATPENGCHTQATPPLRVCRVTARSGLWVSAAGPLNAHPLSAFLWAALAAAALVGALAWGFGLRGARFLLAPLTALGRRISALPVQADALHLDLGPPDGIAEVDALRDTVAALLARVDSALQQAHRFAANAAHELRTPLTVVGGALALLGESLTAPEAQADVRQAQRKVDELVVLVERLLILTVPQRVVGEAAESVSLRDVLEDTLADLPAADRARVRVAGCDALVRGDAVLLGTLVGNALGNGLKFGTQVRVALSSAGAGIVLRFEDDGPGVPEAQRAQVFEPFFRAESAARLPGHGLGLALIRHIARAHGGDAELEARVGGGACLAVRLPGVAGALFEV